MKVLTMKINLGFVTHYLLNNYARADPNVFNACMVYLGIQIRKYIEYNLQATLFNLYHSVEMISKTNIFKARKHKLNKNAFNSIF